MFETTRDPLTRARHYPQEGLVAKFPRSGRNIRANPSQGKNEKHSAREWQVRASMRLSKHALYDGIAWTEIQDYTNLIHVRVPTDTRAVILDGSTYASHRQDPASGILRFPGSGDKLPVALDSPSDSATARDSRFKLKIPHHGKSRGNFQDVHVRHKVPWN